MAWKPIVVGVDGSPESRRAIELAWKIAQAAQADLVPVHAVPDLWLAEGLERVPRLLPELREALVRDSRRGIERFLEGLVPPAARQRLELRIGSAAVAIAEIARKLGAELVVLGGRHHGALARGLGRSTAHYLIRTLDTPVLIAAETSAPVTHVLAAVDLSSASLPTIRAAEHFAKLLNGRLRVVHVVEPLRFTYLVVDMLDQQGFEERSRNAFERLLAPLTEVAPEDRVLRVGPATETLVEEVAAWHAGLIVVGSHGKGWVDRLLVGSTTERLLNTLPASLLVIPTAHARKRAGTPPRRQSRERARKARAPAPLPTR